MGLPAPLYRQVSDAKSSVSQWAVKNPPVLAVPYTADMQDYVSAVQARPLTAAADARLKTAFALLQEKPEDRAAFFSALTADHNIYLNNPATDYAVEVMYSYLSNEERVTLTEVIAEQPHLSDHAVRFWLNLALAKDPLAQNILVKNVTAKKTAFLDSDMKGYAQSMGYAPDQSFASILADMQLAGGTYQTNWAELSRNAQIATNNYYYSRNTHRRRPIRMARADDADDAAYAVDQIVFAANRFSVGMGILSRINEPVLSCSVLFAGR